MDTEPIIDPAAATEPARYFIGTALALALLLLLCAPAMYLPLGRDAANFLLLGREFTAGARPYTDIWDNKPPGIFLLYSLLARDGGESGTPAAPVIFAALAALATTQLLLAGWFRRATPDRFISFVMTVLSALLLPLAAGYWLLGQAEGFALPLLVLAYLLGRQFAARPRFATALAGGLAAGLLPLLKPQFIVVALLPLIAQAITARRAGARLPALLMLVIGLLMPGTLTLLWLAAIGSLTEAWDAVVLFNLAYHESGIGFFAYARLLLAGSPLTALVLCTGIATAACFLFRPRHHDERAGALWWLGAFLAVAAAGRYWLYHWLIAIPATLELARLLWLRFTGKRAQAWRWTITAILLLLALPAASTPLLDWRTQAGGVANEDRLNGRDPHQLAVLGDTLRARLADIAASRQQARAGQPGRFRPRRAWWAGSELGLQVFGYDGDLYVRAGAQPATRFFYDFPLYALPPDGELGQRLRASFLRDLETGPPDLIVIMRHDSNPVERQSSEHQLAAWPELQDWLRGRYRVIDDTAGWIIVRQME